MKIFLVGGAVRDQLLGYPYHEKDWVVVGATPEQMLEQGYTPVGKDFPVFLHPQSKEEYALARTERKTAPGYTGFDFYAAADVTLEQDLARRDLTINAIARDSNNQLVDPYRGADDINNRVLRHVSAAFSEDPVRILRTARFAARYHHLGFKIAEETAALMQSMVASGEVDHLVPERVWAEMQKALSEQHPEVFFTVLKDCGALARILPELDTLFGVPQRAEYHPEVDTGIHTLMVLQQAARLSKEIPVRFAALVHDLGKGLTPAHVLPRHHGHETSGLPLIKALCKRLTVPNNARDLALNVAQFHTHSHRALELKPSTVVKTLTQLDAFRRPERFEQFLLACTADARGRTGFESTPYHQADYLRAALQACQSIDARALAEEGLQGAEIGERLNELRVNAVQAVKKEWEHNHHEH